MENTYLITTDSTTDFDPAYIKEHDIHMVPLSYVVDGVATPTSTPPKQATTRPFTTPCGRGP